MRHDLLRRSLCVCKRRQKLRWSLCWNEQGVGRYDNCLCIIWTRLIASVSHLTSYWFNWIQRCVALSVQITEIPASVLCSCCYSLPFSKSPSSLSEKFDIRVWTERPVHLVEGVLAELSFRLLSWDVKVENGTLQVWNAANSGNFLPTFRATHQSHLQGPRIRFSLRKSPEERIYQLLRGGSLKSC